MSTISQRRAFRGQLRRVMCLSMVTLAVAGCASQAVSRSAQALRVDVAFVNGEPPFSVEAGPVAQRDDAEPAHHELQIRSESRHPVAMAVDDITIHLTGEIVAEGKLAPDDIAVLEIGERRSINVLLPTEGDRGQAGVHQAEVLVPFWADVDNMEPELPDGVASIGLDYHVS